MGVNGGKLVLTFPPTIRAKRLRKDVELIRAYLVRLRGACTFVQLMISGSGASSDLDIYTALGRPFSLGPQAKYDVQPKDRAQIVVFIEKMTQLVRDGYIVPNPTKLWDEGL